MTKLNAALLSLSLAAALTACNRAPAPGEDGATGPAGDSSATSPAEQGTSSPTNPSGSAAGATDEDALLSGQPPSIIKVPPADTPTPDIAAGAQITYLCEDGGELGVIYSGKSAKFALADGRVVTLTRTGSGAQGGGDVYAGDAVALRRLGNVVEVEQGEGGKRVCAESAGSA